MVKQEAVEFLNERAKQGYHIHPMLLELYKEGEEIPSEYLDLCWHGYEERKPAPLMMGKDLYEKFKQMKW